MMATFTIVASLHHKSSLSNCYIWNKAHLPYRRRSYHLYSVVRNVYWRRPQRRLTRHGNFSSLEFRMEWTEWCERPRTLATTVCVCVCKWRNELVSEWGECISHLESFAIKGPFFMRSRFVVVPSPPPLYGLHCHRHIYISHLPVILCECEIVTVCASCQPVG